LNTYTLKTKINRLLTCLISLSVIFAVGCKKDDKTVIKTTPPAVTGPYLYVGGGTFNKGIYWKTSLSQKVAQSIPDTVANAGSITSVITSGSDVYLTGQAGGYWKNNFFVPVTGASNIVHLALSGTDVYTAGIDNMVDLAYWKNNTETDIQNTINRNSQFPYQGGGSNSLSGIALSGSNVLVTGILSFENEPGSPNTPPEGGYGLLWTNGNLQLYGQGYPISAVDQFTTVGVAVSGSDVYVAGRMPAVNYPGGYWKNGVFNSINNGAFISSSIITNGTDVYITGFTNVRPLSASSPQQAAYWKNGTFATIAGGSSATAIAINGTDVYILGIDSNGNNVVWKNGSLFETLGSASSQLATCIAIGS